MFVMIPLISFDLIQSLFSNNLHGNQYTIPNENLGVILGEVLNVILGFDHFIILQLLLFHNFWNFRPLTLHLEKVFRVSLLFFNILPQVFSPHQVPSSFLECGLDIQKFSLVSKVRVHSFGLRSTGMTVSQQNQKCMNAHRRFIVRNMKRFQIGLFACLCVLSNLDPSQYSVYVLKDLQDLSRCVILELTY